MKILILIVLSYCMVSSAIGQQTKSTFNLDFENLLNEKPIGWDLVDVPNYIIGIDSTDFKSGNHSLSIACNEGEPSYSLVAFEIPENYEGKKITLSGYIKTKDVKNGFAGLWMRIDPSIAFDNMQNRGITGTTEWTKYEITLDLFPDQTERVVIGALLVGSGKMWVDDFNVSVDGTTITELKPLLKEIEPAKLDKEFDEGSEISELTLVDFKLEWLHQLGLIWGFLKYYHPSIAAGNFNWDYELFRIVQLLKNASDDISKDQIIVDWIKSLGEFTEKESSAVKNQNVKSEPNLEWINSSGFSIELRNLLLKVKNAKKPKTHYYVQFDPNVGNPIFKNENEYANFKYPDAGYRLLAIYRYWNMINYFYPYKNLIQEDVDHLLPDFIPKIVASKNELDYTLTILELIGRIKDTHANLWGENEVLGRFFGNRFAPIGLAFVENRAVVTYYYNDQLGAESGLKIGDVITHVNHIPVEELLHERLKYCPASNYQTQLRIFASILLRSNDEKIEISFNRFDQEFVSMVKTYASSDLNIYKEYSFADTCFKELSNGILYVNHGKLTSSDIEGVWIKMKKAKGLIIDLRQYPSEFLLYQMSALLMPKKTPFAKVSVGSLDNPGTFAYNEPLSVGIVNKKYFKGKVVILVNEQTQSSGEFHAMAYRVHPNSLVIGSQTAGADGNVTELYLPGNLYSMFSGIGIYYPDGTETQGIGIVPNIEVKPTIKGVIEGRDELVEKAIELIMSR